MAKKPASSSEGDGSGVSETKDQGDGQKKISKQTEQQRKPKDDAIVIQIRIPRPVFWACAVLFGVLSLVIAPYMLYLRSRLYQDALQQQTTADYPLILDESDEVVTIRSYFTPLDTQTMTKDIYDEMSSPGGISTLNGLKAWKSTNIQWQNFGASHFKFFFPKDESYLQKLGEVYEIVKIDSGSFFHSPLSSNRYYPPVVLEDEVVLHRMLAMFHPRPFLYTRFEPRGTVACVRAYNEEFIEIVFRIHAEFQLNEPPMLPFWFTPGQFTGHVIMSHDGKKLLDFDMYVPTNRSLNVDMEWFNEPSNANNMEVDIGYMADMSLKTLAASQNLEGPASFKTTVQLPADDQHQLVLQDLQWTHEISLTKALKNLEVKLFPFKEAVYEEFSTAYARAEVENRLVHLILLWGALDDQSC